MTYKVLKQICLVLTKDEKSGAWGLAKHSNQWIPMGCSSVSFELASYESLKNAKKSELLSLMPEEVTLQIRSLHDPAI